MSDGARGNGTGVAYLYITPLDQVSIDLSVTIKRNTSHNTKINECAIYRQIHVALLLYR